MPGYSIALVPQSSSLQGYRHYRDQEEEEEEEEAGGSQEEKSQEEEEEKEEAEGSQEEEEEDEDENAPIHLDMNTKPTLRQRRMLGTERTLGSRPRPRDGDKKGGVQDDVPSRRSPYRVPGFRLPLRSSNPLSSVYLFDPRRGDSRVIFTEPSADSDPEIEFLETADLPRDGEEQERTGTFANGQYQVR